MKRIIELPDKIVKAIQNGEDYRYDIHTAIAQSKPYNPSGDCISREALKEAVEQGEGISWDSHGKDDLCVRKKYIDNAQAVENSEIWEKGFADGLATGAKWVERPKGTQIAWEQGYEAGLAQGKHDRPKGEWIAKEETPASVSYYCSVCKAVGIPITPFCPWCGADMKGGAE